MTREEVDGLIEFATSLADLTHNIENNLYSTSENVDENEISLRIYAMHKLINNINDAVRYLDESWFTENVRKKST